MKKLLLSLAAVAVLSTGAFAQLKGGVKAGFNFANVGGDAEDTDMRTSIHLGGYLNYAVSDMFSLQPELLYNSVGWKESGDGFDGTGKLNYLSIPVMAKFSFGSFHLMAGPQLGMLLSAKYKVEFDGESETEDIKDGFKGMDFGLNLGLGADFGKLNAGLRYSAGLSNIIDTEEDVTVTNNVIQLSVGYTLFGAE
jgi:hypothetical protein